MFFIIYCNSSIIIPIFELTYNFLFHYMDMVEIEKLASIQIEDFFLFIFANLFSFFPFSCRIYLSLLLLSFVCSNHFPFINLWNFFAVTHFSSLVTTLLSLVIPLTFNANSPHRPYCHEMSNLISECPFSSQPMIKNCTLRGAYLCWLST